MAIRIIEGVPGSGKSYYAVRHLANVYFEKQKDGRYELTKDVCLITNIDTFNPDHLDLRELIKDTGGVKEFFAEDFQRALTECIGKPIVYIIDEAQKYFRKGARDLEDVYSYFEYHRHFGHDVYLITQNAKKLPPDIALLAEYVVVAAPRSRSVVGEFKYKWISDGEILKREGFRPDQGVFALYKSMDQKETEKVGNPVMKTVAAVAVLVLLVGGALAWYMHRVFSPPPAVASTSPGPDPQGPDVSASPTPAGYGSAPRPGFRRVVVSSTSVIHPSGEAVFIVHRGCFYPVDQFPWKVTRLMGSLWADLPESEIESSADEPSPRNDGAGNASGSGAARGVDPGEGRESV